MLPQHKPTQRTQQSHHSQQPQCHRSQQPQRLRSNKKRLKRRRQQPSSTLINDIQNASIIIDNRLYFTVTKHGRKISANNNCMSNIHLFCIDHVLRYEPFFVDFGPLNLGCLYKFCELMKHKLADVKYKNMKIIYYCDGSPQHISNACFLIGGYSIIYQSKTAANAYLSIQKFAMMGAAFRDASMGLCSYKCSVEHCLYAIYHSHMCKFLDFSTFDINEYEHYERVECGDLNIIIPNKFLAFAGPYHKEFDEEGYPALTADFYIPIWKKFNVRTIIRLNKKCYDRRIFTHAGFRHYDLYFVDGTTPSMSIINKFLSICECKSNTVNNGLLAVHCKAGLGRTGSCIGCYLMKHYCWTAGEVIAWMRICRPGSVIGPQQQFLENMQQIMWKDGDLYRAKHNIHLEYDPRMMVDECDDDNHNRKKVKNSRKAFVKRYLESGNKNKENYNTNVVDYECKSRQMLPTDPGMNQGQALKDAKAKHCKSGGMNNKQNDGMNNFFNNFVGWKKSGKNKHVSQTNDNVDK